MSIVAYINLAIAVIGIVLAAFTLKAMTNRRRSEPIIGDIMVLIAYLLMINSDYLLSATSYQGMAAAAWHVFDLSVLLNIIFHIRNASVTRSQ